MCVPQDGRTALHVAAVSDNAQVALKLVEAGAELSAKDKVSDAVCVH